MFIPEITVMEMLVVASHLLYFLLMAAKCHPHFWAKYLGASERSYLVLSENFMNF